MVSTQPTPTSTAPSTTALTQVTTRARSRTRSIVAAELSHSHRLIRATTGLSSIVGTLPVANARHPRVDGPRRY